MKILHIKFYKRKKLSTIFYYMICLCSVCVIFYVWLIWKDDYRDVESPFEGERSIRIIDHVQPLYESNINILENPKFQVKNINCASLFEGDKTEIEVASLVQSPYKNQTVTLEHYVTETRDCNRFIKDRGYIMRPLSKEESNFPIAFSILIFKDFEQFERLLRAIYRPQNFYCVHVDNKSDVLFQQATKAVVDCFENAFIASRSFDVRWGRYSVLETELVCMEDLWKRSGKWKYFINLTGQEFPLKTNGQLVKILGLFNGANNIEGTLARVREEHKEYLVNAPHRLNVTKGSVHLAATRRFIDYILHNSIAKDFREFVEKNQRHIYPEEYYFSSLNHNPNLGIPGSFKGIPETDTERNLFITRFKNWGVYPFEWPCQGKWVRQLCIFGVGDLPLLASRRELFANKFHLDYQPLTLDCMEELHYNRTRDEVNGKVALIEAEFYKNLDFVQNHVS